MSNETTDGDDTPAFPTAPLAPFRFREIDIEDDAGGVVAEATRLAGLDPATWLFLLKSSAARFGVEQGVLEKMIKAVIKEREKKQRRDEVEARRLERKSERERELAQQRILKAAERKEKAKSKAFDVGKYSFHVFGIDEDGLVISRKVSRAKLVDTVNRLDPKIVAMEACGSAHHWGRLFQAAGRTVRLINAYFVKPFVRGSKNDRSIRGAIDCAHQALLGVEIDHEVAHPQKRGHMLACPRTESRPSRILAADRRFWGVANAAASVRRGSGVTPLRGRTVAKRGRPPGATSWWRNPNHVAAHHAQVLMELWLAGAPVLEIRVMLSSLAGNPEQQALIEECWSKHGNDRRYTVQPKIKRKLCRLAVAHVVELRCDAIQRRRARAAKTALRNQGWTDTQVAEILGRRGPERIDFEAPDLEKVLEIVNRCAPATTLRRKATSRKLRK